MNIKEELNKIGLTQDNCIVIGSGILNALHLRTSNDIDAIVTEEKYQELSNNVRLKKGQTHGREILEDGLFEIGTSFTPINKTWKFEELLSKSTVINGVRYNSLEFLLQIKRRWITAGNGRQKDIDDVSLIERYISEQKS